MVIGWLSPTEPYWFCLKSGETSIPKAEIDVRHHDSSQRKCGCFQCLGRMTWEPWESREIIDNDEIWWVYTHVLLPKMVACCVRSFHQPRPEICCCQNLQEPVEMQRWCQKWALEFIVWGKHFCKSLIRVSMLMPKGSHLIAFLRAP